MKEAAGKTLTYSYDAVGNRATLTDPDGGLTTYSYDSRNQLNWLLNPYTERSTWVYDVIGRVTTMTHGNASIAETDYDAAGRAAAVRNLKADRSVLSVFTYSYDNAGNRTAVAEANGDLVTWSYDETYQLTREQRSGASAYDITYSYDAVGNRLSKVDGGAVTTYSYDGANQLTVESAPGGLTTYTYDANGNTQVMNAAGSLTTYAWDIEDHITLAQLPGGGRNTFSYDGDGKRRRMEETASARDLIWDGENVLREQEGATVVAQYTQAPERYGALVSQRRGNATSFHHFDALGSTERLTDASQGALISYLYRAFGEQSVLSGSHANPLTWVGRLGYYRQADSADYWLRARVYRPTVGRFVSKDPVRQTNLYMWPANAPVLVVDPSGQGVCSERTPAFEICGQNEGSIAKLQRMCAAPPPGGGTRQPPPPCQRPSGSAPGGGKSPWQCDPTAEASEIRARIREIDVVLAEGPEFWYICTACCCTPPQRLGERWGSMSATFYCQAWSGLASGCVKSCLEEHEAVHRRQCGTSTTNAEGEAYGEEKRCLQTLLAGQPAAGSASVIGGTVRACRRPAVVGRA